MVVQSPFKPVMQTRKRVVRNFIMAINTPYNY